jgi:hypothetical protein
MCRARSPPAVAIAGATASLRHRCPVVDGRARRNGLPGQTAGIDSVLGDRVAQSAYNELNAPSRKVESPFLGLQLYSGVFNVGSIACPGSGHPASVTTASTTVCGARARLGSGPVTPPCTTTATGPDTSTSSSSRMATTAPLACPPHSLAAAGKP